MPRRRKKESGGANARERKNGVLERAWRSKNLSGIRQVGRMSASPGAKLTDMPRRRKERKHIMDILIRKERESDYYASELVTKRAFWNKYNPGCSEHYLVHRLREDAAYLPELGRVAEADGKVVGLIMYSKAVLKRPAKTETAETPAHKPEEIPILCFGPLCVDPDYQGKGIGGALIAETKKLAAEAGYAGIVIFGEPDYYPRHGFRTCDTWGITTADGKNFDAFMGCELTPGGLNYPGAGFYEAKVFENLPEAEIEAYDKQFPQMPKLRLPGQWGNKMQYCVMTEEDIRRVIPLYMEQYNEYDGGTWTEAAVYKRIHQVWSREDSLCLLLEEEGEILGFAMGSMEQYDDCAAYDLIEIVIAHAHQRKGLGTAFLRELEKRVKKMGASLVQLSAVNDRMHEVFYGKLQYKDADSLKIKTKWLR